MVEVIDGTTDQASDQDDQDESPDTTPTSTIGQSVVVKSMGRGP
jgi:hypothetical protein